MRRFALMFPLTGLLLAGSAAVASAASCVFTVSMLTGVDVNNLDFKVKFAGLKVGAGTVEEFGAVPGATTDTLQVPFSVDYLDAIEALAAVASGEALKVDLSATSDVTTPFGVVPLSIDENGNVDVVEE